MNKDKILGSLQKLGKALMLPVAVLPAAGLLLRFGQDDLLNLPFMSAAGDAILGNLPILFAIGVAVGLAFDGSGAAGLAGAIGYFVITDGAGAINEEINMGVLAGIMAGLLAGNLYNRFHDIELPDWLAFFGGRRFVPIVTAAASIVLALIFGYVWPPIQAGIDAVGNWTIASGSIGVFMFAFLNRLLIPLGLHHILNNIVWFVFGNYNGAQGDIARFFAGDPSAGIFQAGFYPIMMFGLVGAALAMYSTAKDKNKQAAKGLLFSVAFTAFLTGITEPIEFMFMFLAPSLYFIHAVLSGISMAIVYKLGIRHGFYFSAGALDYFLNMKFATKGWLLLPIGLAFGVLYYVIFRAVIVKRDLPTPGREEDSQEAAVIVEDEDGDNLAKAYIEALGGSDNLENISNCITRLRLVVKDGTKVDDARLKALGATGVMRPSEKNIQVIIGTKAELLADSIKRNI